MHLVLNDLLDVIVILEQIRMNKLVKPASFAPQ